MIRANSAARAFQKRTIRPLYAWHSAVPYACFLDVAAVGTTQMIYPGMVSVKTTGEQMDVPTTEGDVPFGLFNNFVNGVMDELQGGTEISVWTGYRDAVFEILAGPSPSTGETPLDQTVTWTSLNSTRGGVALFGHGSVDGSGATLVTAGQLTNSATGDNTLQAARLIEAVSNSKIIVQLVLAVA